MAFQRRSLRLNQEMIREIHMNTSPHTHRIDPGAADHDPDLYKSGGVAQRFDGLSKLGDRAVEDYQREGFIAVDHVFDPSRVSDALAAIDDLVAGRNEAFEGVMFESRVKEQGEAADPQARLDLVRKLSAFVGFDPRLAALASDPALLSVVRRLMGGREPALFQDMALLKPPGGGREKPWHQDHAYFDLAADTPVVGVWIALDPATLDNGCMHLLPGEHRAGAIIHFKRRDWQICDDQIQGRTSTACPLEPGGALFFDSYLPHGTPTNRSAQRRRALQFHYAPADAVKVDTAQRLALFGPEGKDVTC